jgi:hypothetical protein
VITRTVIQHEGEWFTDGTPDEWFAAHTLSANAGPGRDHRDLTDEQRAMVRLLTTKPPEGKFWLVQTNGYWHKLWTVGLYDGWVFWRPRVCVGTDGPIGGMHTHEGYHIEAVALGEPNDHPRAIYPWRIVRDADGHPAPTTTAAALLVEGCAACGGTGDAVEVGS